MRRLLVALALVCAVTASTDAQRIRVRARVRGPASGSSATFTQSDLVLDGAFQISRSAQTADGSDGLYNSGMAVRSVAGVPHLFMTSLAEGTYEFVIPALKTAGASGSSSYYNDATVYAYWGNVLGSYQQNCAAETPWYLRAGLYWDATNSRIWKTYGADYPQGDASYVACYTQGDPFYGYGTLGSIVGTTGTSTPVGAWRVSSHRYKGLYRGVYEIPPAWQSAMGGHDIAVWGGGYGSLLCNPDLDASAGPASVAISSSDFPRTQGSAVSNDTPLLGWFNGYCGSAGTARASVPTLAIPRTDVFGVNGTTGVNDKFSYDDLVTGMAMVDTGTHSGLLSFEWYFAGWGQYINSGLSHAAADHYLRIYSLSDIARVASGAVAASSLTPASHARFTFPDLDYAAPAMALFPSFTCTSVTATAATANGHATCTGLNAQALVYDGQNLAADMQFQMFGANESDFNDGMRITGTPSGDTFNFIKTNGNFTNTSATGSVSVRRLYNNTTNAIPGYVDQAWNLIAYDRANQKLYIGVLVPFTGAGANARIVVYRYSVT